MIIYRGIAPHYRHGDKAIPLSEINDRHTSDTYYGNASYYALSKEGAERYANGSTSMLFFYSVSPSNLMEISSEELPALKNFELDEPSNIPLLMQEKFGFLEKMLITSISDFASENHYDSILLTGNINGGEQFIIPKESKLELTLIKIEIRFQKNFFNYTETYEKLLRHFEKLNLSAEESKWQIKVTLTPSDRINHQDFFDWLFSFPHIGCKANEISFAKRKRLDW